MPISFTSAQLNQAPSLPVETRDAFLRMVADQLRISDVDVVDAIDRALHCVNWAR